MTNLERLMKAHPGGLMTMSPADRFEAIQGLRYAKKHGLQVDVPDEKEAGAVRSDESLFGRPPGKE